MSVIASVVLNEQLKLDANFASNFGVNLLTVGVAVQVATWVSDPTARFTRFSLLCLVFFAVLGVMWHRYGLYLLQGVVP